MPTSHISCFAKPQVLLKSYSQCCWIQSFRHTFSVVKSVLNPCCSWNPQTCWNHCFPSGNQTGQRIKIHHIYRWFSHEDLHWVRGKYPLASLRMAPTSAPVAPSEDAPARAAALLLHPAGRPCAEASHRAVHEASRGPCRSRDVRRSWKNLPSGYLT